MKSIKQIIIFLSLSILCCLVGMECYGFGREIFNRADEISLRYSIDCMTLCGLHRASRYNDFYEVEKSFTYKYTDSLNHATRMLICSKTNNNPFYPFEVSSDSITVKDPIWNGNSNELYYSAEMYQWLNYLIAISKMAYFSGYGRTIGMDYIITSSDSPEEKIMVGPPLNFTQCLAAVDWYDLNRNLIDPRLFLYFQSNSRNGRYGNQFSPFNQINFVWDVAAGIDIDNVDDSTLVALDSIVEHRMDSIKHKADSMYHHIRDNMISVTSVFRLKDPGNYKNFDSFNRGHFVDIYRLGLRFLPEYINGGYIDFSDDSLDYFYEKRPAFEINDSVR